MRFFCVAAVVTVACSHCALGQVQEFKCGYVVSSYCPGCTPNDPGGCGCGASGGSCACIGTDGKPQTGTRVVCDSGPYRYNQNMSGWKITKGAFTDCGTASQCDEQGTECTGSTPCTGGACTWTVVTQYQGRPLEETEETCDVNPH